MHYLHLVFSILFTLSTIQNLHSEIPVIRLDPNIDDLNFSNFKVAYYADPSKTMIIDEIKPDISLFQLSRGNSIFPSGTKNLWLSFILEKNSDDVFRNYLVQFGNAHIAAYEIYIYDELGLISKKTQGDNYNYNQREVRHNFFVHNLPDVPGNLLNIFIRIDQEGQEVNFPINVYKQNHFIQHTLRVKMFHGLIIGLFLITSIVTFILFIIYNGSVRNRG